MIQLLYFNKLMLESSRLAYSAASCVTSLFIDHDKLNGSKIAPLVNSNTGHYQRQLC
jgi:hypothetical protein